MTCQVQISQRRIIAVCGHGSSGKTSLLDALLQKTGAISGSHNVDDGTSVCDFDPEERIHKHTIEAKVLHCQHRATYFTLLDTPGYSDCIGQTIGALSAADSAAICIHAHAGIEVTTRRVFKEVVELGVPCCFIISRLDGDAIDFQRLVAEIRQSFGNNCVLMNVPSGLGTKLQGVINVLALEQNTSGAAIDVRKLHEQLIEAIVETDEDLMEKYLQGEIPTSEQLIRHLPHAVLSGEMIPIFCVCSKSKIGLEELLDGLAHCMPSPDQIERHARTPDGSDVILHADPTGPLVAQVFKTRIDPFVQKLSYIRVYSGTLTKDQNVHLDAQRKSVRLPNLLEVQASKTQVLDHAEAGQIIAVTKVDDLHTGTVLGDVMMPSIPFPQPMVGLALRSKSHNDETKLSVALHKLVEEDPTLRLDRDPQTSELVITGMSELHLKLILDRLQHRDKLSVETKDPKIPFRETIQVEAEGFHRHKKQSGGRGQFSEVHIRMFPLPHGTDINGFATESRFPNMKAIHYDTQHNFLWIDSVVGASIPGNFMPAIEKGFKERLLLGVIAGYPIQDVAVEVHFGKHHPVDSSEAAFKIAASIVFRKVFLDAHPCLLEPIVRMNISTPTDNIGDVYSDMSGRGGKVLGNESLGSNFQLVHCEVPLRAVLHYNRTLSSMTGGQGSYAIEMGSYEKVPFNVQQQVLANAKVAEEVET
jgi:elongation factor G